MAIQFVNVGAAPNDGTGDLLRDGFIKINSNFGEISVSLAEVITDISDIQIDITAIEAELLLKADDANVLHSTGTIPETREAPITFNDNVFMPNIVEDPTPTVAPVGIGTLTRRLVQLPIDENLEIVVTNKTGVTIPKGSVVYINGAQGSKPTIALALADTNLASSLAIGIVVDDIPNNSNTGRVVTNGIVERQNTSAFNEGDRVFLSSTIPGGMTTTPPVSPNNVIFVGTIVAAHNIQGRILVSVAYTFKLDRLVDVSITSPIDNQVLTYDGATGLWKNESAAPGGVSTASNGLTVVGNDVRWGGTLTEDTIINATNKTITYNSNISTPFIFLNTTGGSLFAQAVSGVGLGGSSQGNYGVLGSSNLKAGLASVFTSSDNSAVKVTLDLNRNTSGPTPVNGIGQSIIFRTQNSTGNDIANEIISKWVDVIANTSEYSITGVFQNNTLPLFTLRGNGLARLNQYGVTQPVGVGSPAFALNIDNTGNIIQVPIGVSSAVQSIVPGTNITVNNTDPANPIVSAIPSTSAGVFDRVYFTGQVASVATPVGPNYDSIRNGKGSVASIALVVAGLNASTKLYIPNDIIGPAQSVAGTLPLGNYTGFLSVQASAATSLKRFTIEVFLCDNAGVIIPSSGPVSGSTDPFYAGKNTVTILDSGDLNLGNGTVTQVGLTSYLANAIPVVIGQRFRYHISVSRGAAGGGAQTMTVFIGNTANSYVEAPVPITSTTVVNVSNVAGATVTDALNTLNSNTTYVVVAPATGSTLTQTSGEVIVKCDSSSGAFIINLPTAVGNKAKFQIKKMVAANSVTIDAFGTQTIDGGLTATMLVAQANITIVSDNSNWIII